MFGESESESPRVPSPWDSLISTATPSPQTRPVTSSSPLMNTLIPKLVPESDDGNVEYKLQLLNPSDGRFTRLVTQLKWRLLEGGGQAYYELGVADSGALVGLPRAELEQSLETLEMMAGEIGASVIVVKEIEVPAALVDLTVLTDDYRRLKKQDEFLIGSLDSEKLGSEASTTEAETSVTEDEEESRGSDPDASATSLDVFAMDSVDDSDAQPPVAIDIEISAVYKPRPIRTRIFKKSASGLERRRKEPKLKKVQGKDLHGDSPNKGLTRRQARDRRREEKRKALEVYAANSLAGSDGNRHIEEQIADATPHAVGQPVSSVPSKEADALVHRLEGLHVSVQDHPQHDHPQPTLSANETIPALTLPTSDPPEPVEAVDGEDDDVFPSTTNFHTALSDSVATLRDGKAPRLIVEALVVRKMSLEEGFLDFGGFALT